MWTHFKNIHIHAVNKSID